MSAKVPYFWLILISLALLALVGLQLTDKILEQVERDRNEQAKQNSEIQVDASDENAYNVKEHGGIRSEKAEMTALKRKTATQAPVSVDIEGFRIGLASLEQLRSGRMKRASPATPVPAAGWKRIKRQVTNTTSTTKEPRKLGSDEDETDPSKCDPKWKYCGPVAPSTEEPIPTVNFEGSLQFGDRNCWLNDRLADEMAKGISEYSPEEGNINAGIQKKTKALNEHGCKWSKQLECKTADDEGTKCGCMPQTTLEIKGVCYLNYGKECGGVDSGPFPLPAGIPHYKGDPNPIRFQCAPGATCVASKDGIKKCTGGNNAGISRLHSTFPFHYATFLCGLIVTWIANNGL